MISRSLSQVGPHVEVPIFDGSTPAASTISCLSVELIDGSPDRTAGLLDGAQLVAVPGVIRPR